MSQRANIIKIVVGLAIIIVSGWLGWRLTNSIPSASVIVLITAFLVGSGRSINWRAIIADIKHIAFGEGRAAWAMAVLWLLFIVAIFFTASLFPTNDNIISILNPSIVLSITVAIAYVHRALTQGDTSLNRLPPIAAAITLISWFAISLLTYILTSWQSLLGADVPAFTLDTMRVTIAFLILSLTFIIILTRRTGFNNAFRMLTAGIIGGALLTALLAYPTQTWAYNTYVPQTLYTGQTHDQVVIFSLIASALVLLLTAPATILVVRPIGTGQRLQIGAIVGLVAGCLVYIFIGGSVAGIAANVDLYGVAISRIGYNDAEWLVKLAQAVNNNFPIGYGLFLLLTGIGALVGGVTGALTPVRGTVTEQDGLIPLWLRTVLIAIPALIQSVTVMVVTLSLLGPAMQNIFSAYGMSSAWNPLWNTFLISSPAWFVATGLQLAVIRYLYRVYLHDGQPCDPLLRNGIIVSSVIAGGFAMLLFASQTQPFIGAAALFTLGLSAETLRIAMLIKPTEQLIASRRDWVTAGVWAGVIVLVLTYPFLIIALNLVLIPVALIPQIAVTDQPAPGLQWLLDALNGAVQAEAAIGAYAVLGFVGSTLFFAVAWVLNLPSQAMTWLFNAPNALLHIIRSRFTSKFNPLIVRLILLAAALIVDFLFLSTPVLIVTWVLLTFNTSLLRRLPTAFVIVPLLLLLLALALPVMSETHIAPPIQLGLIIAAGFTLYRYMGMYSGESARIVLRIALIALAALSAGLIYTSQQTLTQMDGGVSRFDGTQWIVYDQNNSTLGALAAYDILQSPDGTMHFVSNGGAVSHYDGSTWQLALLSDLRRATQNTDNSILLLRQDQQGNFWLVADHRIGRMEEGRLRSGMVEIASLCPPQGITSPFLSVPSCLTTRITDFEIADDGSVWLSTNGIIAHVTHNGAITEAEVRDGTMMRVVDGAQWRVFGDVELSWAEVQGFFLGAYDLAVTADGVVAATDVGVFRFDGETWTSIGGIEDTANSVFVDSTQTVWAGTDDGLWRISDTTGENILSLDGAVTTITEAADGVLWIGTTRGLVSYDPQTGDSAQFNSANSGLAADTLWDVLVAQDGTLWVSTFEIIHVTAPQWLQLLLIIGFVTLIGGGIAFDYRRSPEAQARRKGRALAAEPAQFYEHVYPLIAQNPDSSILHTIAVEVNKAGVPSGALSLLAYADLLKDADVPAALGNLAQALDADSARQWASTLRDFYRLTQTVCQVSSVNAIIALELMTNPEQSGSNSLNTSDYRIDALPPFLPQGTAAFWRALVDVSVNLQKFHEVDDTGDRLSYLAGALSAVETAQHSAQSIAAPDGKVLRTIASTWRMLIADAINLLSGSAELRLELRTRQIQRSDKMVLVLRLDNVGRAAAENIHVALAPSDDYAVVGEASQQIERLAAGRHTPLEFVLMPPDAASVRVMFTLTWDDRLDTGKTLEYADIVRLYDAVGEFQPIPNPYIVGHPVKSRQMFFGREDVFRFIEQNISGTQQDRTIVLYGQRRTGKTSLLYQLVDGQLGERFIPVLIDMQSLTMLIETTGDFLGEIAYQMSRALSHAALKVDIPEINTETKAPTRVFSRFLDNLADGLKGKRVLIIIDEFELIEDKIRTGKLEVSILDYFRSLVQHRDELVFIFTGTHRLEEMSHDYWSILFNIALYRQISYLNEADAIDLIRQPVQQHLTIDDLAVEKIIRLTSGHPYFIQLLCWALVNHCNEHQRSYATINDINDALETMLTTGEAHFSYIWQQATPEQQLPLAALAHTVGRTTLWAQPHEILETLHNSGDGAAQPTKLLEQIDALTAQDVLEIAPEGSLRYRFRLEVLRLWVKQNKSITALIERNRAE